MNTVNKLWLIKACMLTLLSCSTNVLYYTEASVCVCVCVCQVVSEHKWSLSSECLFWVLVD